MDQITTGYDKFNQYYKKYELDIKTKFRFSLKVCIYLRVTQLFLRVTGGCLIKTLCDNVFYLFVFRYHYKV